MINNIRTVVLDRCDMKQTKVLVHRIQVTTANNVTFKGLLYSQLLSLYWLYERLIVRTSQLSIATILDMSFFNGVNIIKPRFTNYVVEWCSHLFQIRRFATLHSANSYSWLSMSEGNNIWNNYPELKTAFEFKHSKPWVFVNWLLCKSNFW